MRRFLAVATVALGLFGCLSCTDATMTAIKVEIVPTANGYQLLRGGEPYTIKGAGMSVDRIKSFAAHGGNSIRNWSTRPDHQDTLELLDSAQAHGVTVALCLPMQPERRGFDYDNQDAVAAQLAEFREEVLKYRNHPALLLWIIGNELNHSYTNPAVFDAVNEVAEMIHELDPNHPTTTALVGFEEQVITEVKARAPALDFVSLQTYGSVFDLPRRIARAGFDAPFMITEWGTLGYWEMEQTSWGAPIELTSSEKADVIMRAHNEVLASFDGQLLGSYVFFWGQKQERTHTWFGLLTETGEETEAAGVMHYIWNGTWPTNRAPRVNSMLLNGKEARDSVTLVAGEAYEALFDVSDGDNDALTFRWEIREESDATQVGGDFEGAIETESGLLANPARAGVKITAPPPGKYRIFAYADDGHHHVAHANIPFLVEGG